MDCRVKRTQDLFQKFIKETIGERGQEEKKDLETGKWRKRKADQVKE